MNSRLVIIFIFFVLFFYLINKYLDYKYNLINENFANNTENKIDIVVARYNEDLKWTLEYPFNQYQYTVYNKGDNEYFEKKYVKKIIKLPNVGKCDHTYLYHVILNYHDLADIVVFFPGSIDLEYKKKIATKILKEINRTQKAIFISLNHNDIRKKHYNFKLNNYVTKHKSNLSKNPEVALKKSSIRPYGLWFDNTFGNIEINCITYYGIFSIGKKDIIQHSVKRYESLIKDLSDHSNPEVGHYIERSWGAIFHPMKDTIILK